MLLQIAFDFKVLTLFWYPQKTDILRYRIFPLLCILHFLMFGKNKELSKIIGIITFYHSNMKIQDNDNMKKIYIKKLKNGDIFSQKVQTKAKSCLCTDVHVMYSIADLDLSGTYLPKSTFYISG